MSAKHTEFRLVPTDLLRQSKGADAKSSRSRKPPASGTTIYYASVEGKLCISRETMVDLTILGGDPPPNSCMASLGFTRNKTSATPEIWADGLLDLAANSLCYHILINDACSITNASTGSHSSLVLWNTQVNSMGLWEYTAEHFTQRIVLRNPVKELVVRIVDHNFQPLPVLGEWSIVLRRVC